MKALKVIFLVLLILVVLIFGVLVWKQLGGEKNPLTVLFPTPTPAPPTLEAPAPSVSMSGEENQRLLDLAYADCWQAEALGEAFSDGEKAVLPVHVTLLIFSSFYLRIFYFLNIETRNLDNNLSYRQKPVQFCYEC